MELKMTDAVASSGNVFADLGFPNPELELWKADIGIEIHRLHEILQNPQMKDYHADASQFIHALLWSIMDKTTKRLPKWTIYYQQNDPQIKQLPYFDAEYSPFDAIMLNKAYKEKYSYDPKENT